jgi:hypothetical protein
MNSARPHTWSVRIPVNIVNGEAKTFFWKSEIARLTRLVAS